MKPDRAVQVYANGKDAEPSVVSDAVLSGAYARPYIIDTRVTSPTIGVHFCAGGATPLLGLPAQELANQHVSLEEIWGREAAIIHERLITSPSPEAMFQTLEQALLKRLTDPGEEFGATNQAVEIFATSDLSAKSVRESMGFSAKRFIRLFQDSVGLTPKLFCRVQRFQRVLDELAPRPCHDWAQLALHSGYYDQPHLIHDFREFAGVTPADYKPTRPDHKNHMPLP